MKFNIGIASALLLVATQAAHGAEPVEVFKVPITTIQGARRQSTVGRWQHILRKYGIVGSYSGGAKGRGRVATGTEGPTAAYIPLTDYDFDREYYGTVKVGEPPQLFKECSGSTHYDPSASETFLLNSDFEKGYIRNANYSAASILDSLPSSNPNAWHITYGDMSHAEGYLGRDHVTLDHLTVRYQQLAIVASESANFDDKIDGIMGLSFGALSSSASVPSSTQAGASRTVTASSTAPAAASFARQKTRTVFENMMDQNLVARGVFSFYLGKNRPDGTSDLPDSDSDYLGGGEVLFGGIDESHIKEGHQLLYTPVTKAKYWQINIENVFVAGTRVDYTGSRLSTYVHPMTQQPHKDNKTDVSNNKKDSGKKKSNVAGIMDTGTTLMIVPERLCSAIHDLIPGATAVQGLSWALPCSYANDQQAGNSIELEIEGQRFAIPYGDLVREPVERGGLAESDSTEVEEESEEAEAEDKPNLRMESDTDPEADANVDVSTTGGQGLCFSGIQPSAANFMIIGDLFIKNNYVVFDQEYQRIGIAPLKFSSDNKKQVDQDIGDDEKGEEEEEEEEEHEGQDQEKDESNEEGSDEEEETEERIEKRGINMRMGWELTEEMEEMMSTARSAIKDNRSRASFS